MTRKRINRKISPRRIETVVLGLLLILICSIVSYSQRCDLHASESLFASHGANELIELRGVKVRVVRGRITDVNGAAITNAIIDVFPMDKSTRQALLVASEDQDEPWKSFQVNSTGEFCLDLPPGSYRLRFGTEVFGFKHTILSVTKISSGSRKPIEIVLEPGT